MVANTCPIASASLAKDQSKCNSGFIINQSHWFDFKEPNVFFSVDTGKFGFALVINRGLIVESLVLSLVVTVGTFDLSCLATDNHVIGLVLVSSPHTPPKT
jgi:hypothetical protein